MKCKLITTVSNPTHPGWLNLKRSLEKFGWDYEICGTEYHQFGSKMVNAYSYAKTTDCTHLFIVDAYDVVVLGTMQEVLSYVKRDSLLWNSEKNAWPYEQWAYLYPPCKSEWKYLNGGMSFVSVADFIAMFEENPIQHTDNDQVVLAKTFLTRGNEYGMRLDTNCDVFQTFCSTSWDEFTIVDNRVINNKTGTKPIFCHFNGKHDGTPIIELI